MHLAQPNAVVRMCAYTANKQALHGTMYTEYVGVINARVPSMPRHRTLLGQKYSLTDGICLRSSHDPHLYLFLSLFSLQFL